MKYTGVKRCYDNMELKIAAMASMLIDHIGAVLIENTVLYNNDGWAMAGVVCRLIGRLAFPLFCFLLVEGFLHTSNKKMYMLRLGLFAMISEMPFDMALYGRVTLYRQNVFFTLFISFIMLIVIQTAERKLIGRPFCIVVQGAAVVLACGAAFFLLTDYSYMGPLLTAVIYFLRNDRKKQCIIGGILFLYELTGSLAFLLIYRYTGEKGESRFGRRILYWFYPLHLLILFGIRYAVCGY